MGSFREEGKGSKLILSRVFLQRRREDFQHSKKILLRPGKREKKFFQKDRMDKDRINFFPENLSSSEVSSRKNDGGSRTELAGRQKCVKEPR